MNLLKNLWTAIGEIPDIETPYSILKKQAQYLNEVTKNLIEGQIKTEQISSSSIETWSPDAEDGLIRRDSSPSQSWSKNYFLIYSPILNWEYSLFEIAYDNINLYPVSFLKNGRYTYYIARNENEFQEKLAEIFNSAETKRIITAIVSQSRAAER